MEAKEWLNDNELSTTIYEKKYRHNNESFDEFLDRVSGGNKDVRGLIERKDFIFGGRILANRGVTDRKVTYSNCYVISPPEDNIESIFDCCSRLARTYSYGGGCGIDISKLRPKGAQVHNAAKESTGAVSFMDVFSQVTGTISQMGRRGALMISMSINHPDVEDFIDCKTDLKKVNYANISVRVNDEFMKAVENNEDYILHWPCDKTPVAFDENKLEYNKLTMVGYVDDPFKSSIDGVAYVKKVKARELFNKLVKNNWDYAEPGILFWDNIENYNILDNDPDFHYAGTNPCAEEPLPAGGSCLLGSINLSNFVIHPFTNKAQIDWDRLEYAVRLSVRALNLVLIEGITLHPLQEQQDSVSQWRQIGLGTLGLADCLIKLGITYGSEESLITIHNIYRMIAVDAVMESLDMAKEYGCYPACNKDLIAKSSFIQHLELPVAVMNEIKKFGLYNSQLLTCAPTGTIGTMLCASTGVEPNFALSYVRRTQSLNGKDTFYNVDADIVSQYKAVWPDATELPKYFVTSADIAPKDRVAVQSELQKWIDASISSTVNLPKEATVADVADIYLSAWQMKLKGITVYRSGCKREAILSTGPAEVKTFVTTSAPKRPKVLEAELHSVKVKGEQFAVIVGLLEDKPYEVFAFKPNMTLKLNTHKGTITKESKMHYSFKSDLLEIKELEKINEDIEEKATTLYASMLLRHGVAIKYIIKTAKKVNDNISSFTSAICRVLAKYTAPEETDEKCPECGAPLINEGGCCHCTSCGWSKCG